MDLKELLGEELFAQVEQKAKEQKAKVDIVSNGEWLPKAKFDDTNQAKAQLEKQLAERDKQLEDLKHNSGSLEDLNAKIAELQKENKDKQAEYEKALADERKANAIKLDLKGRVHDPDIVMGLLDRDKIIQQEDGSITGLTEQLKPLEENKGFLFIHNKPPEEANRFTAFSPRNNEGSGGTGMEHLIDETLKNL